MSTIRPLPFNLIIFSITIIFMAILFQIPFIILSGFLILYFPVFLGYLTYEIVQINRQKNNKIYEPFIIAFLVGIALFFEGTLVTNIKIVLITFLDAGRGFVEEAKNGGFMLLLQIMVPFYLRALLGGILGVIITVLIEDGGN